MNIWIIKNLLWVKQANKQIYLLDIEIQVKFMSVFTSGDGGERGMG